MEKKVKVLLFPKILHSSEESVTNKETNNVTSDLAKCYEWMAGKWPSEELKLREDTDIAKR